MDYKKILDELITNLIDKNGSDLHLSVSRIPAIRIATELTFLNAFKALTETDIKGLLTELIGKENFEKFQDDKEFDFAFDFNKHARIRGNAFFQRGDITIALRLIPKAKTIEELNLPPILEVFARKKQGFFLIVGPVGQGKSTTMSAMINLINDERATHIVTIEDPIEFVFKPNKSIIDQREVGIDTKDFDSALGSVFREDVNVIMIGEMRTPKTISTAVTAAETGHLVLSTLHTNNASQTILRIIDSFPSTQQSEIRSQLAGSLLGVFSQRLIQSIKGGLVPAYELMINNNAIANLIRENRIHEIDIVIETSFQQGMIDMNRSLIELVEKGEISIESAMEYSLNPKGLSGLM